MSAYRILVGDRRWRQHQSRAVRTVGGVGVLPREIEAKDAGAAAILAAKALFGQRGRLVSLLYVARTAGKWGRMAGKMWQATICGDIDACERAWGGVAPVLRITIEAGSVAACDMPPQRYVGSVPEKLKTGVWRHVPRVAAYNTVTSSDFGSGDDIAMAAEAAAAWKAAQPGKNSALSAMWERRALMSELSSEWRRRAGRSRLAMARTDRQRRRGKAVRRAKV